MKVLFAVSNENTSQAIIKKYQSEYKQIISSKNVYYFNAILKELQRDKTYDRVVISEDLEQYVNNDYEQMDKFLFDRLDSISDEASNVNGEDIPIILLCTERRNKSESILVKLFGIGIYNAIIGNDRSAAEVCRLLNRPRSKKEAKVYYKIDSDDVTYGREDENDVSESEIKNILAHYKRIGNDEEKYVESFDSIAEQYNDMQLKVISKCLPLNVRAVLEEKSPKYQKINSYNNKLNDQIRIDKKEEKKGTSEILLKNDNAKQLSRPVVIPSAIDASKGKKILTKPSQTLEENHQEPIKNVIQHQEAEEENDILQDIELEDLHQNTEEQSITDNDIDILQVEELEVDAEIEPEIEQEIEPEMETEIEEKTENETEIDIEENVVQPVKRGRGRPRKNISQQESEQPKKKRGRPRKVVESEENAVNDELEEVILPGFEEEATVPTFEEATILPGFDDNENLEEMLQTDNKEEVVLPGFEDAEEDEEFEIPGFTEDENQYIDSTNDLQEENNKTNEFDSVQKQDDEYAELVMNELIDSTQKLVAFVGTSKNGTSFLVNNVAEILSMNGIDTAILDLTQNRNSYYIFTKNDEKLRNKSSLITSKLKEGIADGIVEHKNLTIYTSPLENDENLKAVEPIVEILVKNHTVVLMDCDFTTPMKYFKYAQEIYLVQSMDVLTIQPLTAFIRRLADKEMFEESKARVVLNKFRKTKEINENLLIGGMSIYNDAAMTVRKELFDRRRVQSIAIPFDEKTYFRYLDGLVICDISLKGYSKEFLQCLKNLASMVYQGIDKKGKYMPPSVKNNNNGFSPRVNNTLNQMKQNY